MNVTKRTSLGILVLCWVAWQSAADVGRSAEAERPNIVVALADDLGYGDLACYGNPVIKTPNLDRLAAEGMRLTSYYAPAANCSPSRTGLMTGRTPNRVGVYNWIPMFSPMHVGREEITIATLLRSAGYSTCHAGKWHLNGQFNLPGQPQPSDHGFDHWFSTQNNALPCHHDPDDFVRNGEPVGRLEGYSGPLVAGEAIRWLEHGRDPEKPFFLFVCFHEPHEPIATDERFVRMYSSDDPSLPVHHGNVTQLDHAFGLLMQALDRLDLDEDTLVFFASDNGPAITSYHPHGSAGPLRHKKGHLYEGGIRVPGIIRWPGRVPAGGVCDEPISGLDFLPTVCELVGIGAPKDRPLDGTSVLPIIEGRPITRKTPLYWQFNYASSKPKVALRIGDWKLLAHLNSPEEKPTAGITAESQQAIHAAEPTEFELYNLRDDLGETTDLAEKEPERVAAMAEELKTLFYEVRRECPTWPPFDWPRYEGKRIRAAQEAGIWPQWKKAQKPK